jgi:hypothetical protein
MMPTKSGRFFMAFYKRASFWAAALIALALAQKFYGFGRPLLGHHAWRQADTAAVARNFYAGGMKFFYPEVDWGGPGPNYCETEFPAYSYAAAALYHVFGAREWLGRALSLAAYGAALLLVFAIGRRLMGAGAALGATFLFAVSPIAGFMGRAFMPESWVLAASLASAFFFLRWLDDGGTGDFFDAAAFLALAGALKLTAFHLLLWFGALALRYRRRELASPAPWLVLAGAFVPAAAWYWHAHQLYLKTGLTFGIWVAGDKWATLATLTSGGFYRKMLVENVAANVLTWPGLVLALAGVALLAARRTGFRYKILTWLGAAVVYLLVLARGAFEHDYYSLPLVAPAALAGGYAAAEGLKLFRRNAWGKAAAVATALLLAAAVPSFTGKFRSFVRVNDAAVRAGTYLNSVDASGAPIITFNDGGPQWLYYCERKGWILSPKGPLAEDASLFASLVDKYEAGGARFLVADMNYYGLMSNDVQKYLDDAHERLTLGDGFAVWRLVR